MATSSDTAVEMTAVEEIDLGVPPSSSSPSSPSPSPSPSSPSPSPGYAPAAAADPTVIGENNNPPSTAFLCFADVKLFNVVLMGTSFLVLFTGYNSVQNLLTTVVANLGFASLAIVYAAFALTSLCVTYLAQLVEAKRMMLIGAAGYFAFTALNVSPSTAGVLVASVLVGVAAAVLWTAQGVLQAQNADEHNMARRSGLFFSLFLTNSILGNVLVGLLFHAGWDVWQVFLLMAGLCAVGCLMLLFLQPVPPRADTVDEDRVRRSLWSKICALYRLQTTRIMLLLLPLMLYQGSMTSFIIGYFPTLIGSKTLIGFAMATYGVGHATGSLALGSLSDRFGRVLSFAVILVLHVLGLTMTFWADRDKPGLFFAILLPLGFGDSALHTLLYALNTTLNPSHVTDGFALLQLVRAIAVSLFAIFELFMPLPAVLGMLLFLLVLGMAQLAHLHRNVHSVEAGGLSAAATKALEIPSLTPLA